MSDTTTKNEERPLKGINAVVTIDLKIKMHPYGKLFD